MPKYEVIITQTASKEYEADNREHLDAILFEEEFDDVNFRVDWEVWSETEEVTEDGKAEEV